MALSGTSRAMGRRNRARSRLRVHAVESLEPRNLFALAALTLADSSFYGASAAGVSGNATGFSSDGQLLAFESDAGNLTASDENGLQDVFVRDVGSGATILVSATPGGASGNGASYHPVLSADGRYVLFESDASDLVVGDNNHSRDVFRRDLQTGTTELASGGLGGAMANSGTFVQDLSRDGRKALFLSSATNLVSLSTVGQQQLFVHDFQTATTSLVSVNFSNTAGGNSSSAGIKPAVFSPNGRFVAYESTSTDIVNNDLNGIRPDIYLRDLELNATSIVSVNLQGTGTSDHFAEYPVFDATGQKIAFISKSSDLTADPPLGFPAFRVFVRDLGAGVTELVSKDHTFDAATPLESLRPVFSPDGRYVAYEGVLSDSVTGLYARDLVAGATLLVSANTTPGNHLANGRSTSAAFSPSGQDVYFASTATNLAAGASSGVSQIYRRNLVGGGTSLVSLQTDGAPGVGDSSRPVMAATGEWLAFQSRSTGLAADDNNALQDLWIVDTTSGAIRLGSPRSPALPLAYTSRTLATDLRPPTGLSSDGRYVTFTSDAADLVANGVTGRNVYRFDRQLNQTQVVNLNSDGQTASGNVAGNPPAMSADGRFVVFASNVGQQIIPGLPYEPDSSFAIYVRDMELDTTRAVNLNSGGRVSSNSSDPFFISPNGHYVAFATNRQLLPNDTNGATDVYVFDVRNNVLSLVSATGAGAAGNGASSLLAATAVGDSHQIFSDDGRYLLFRSSATDLVAAGGASDALYRRDLDAGTTALASVTADGAPATTFGYALSGDGRRAVLVTNSPLVSQDTNNQHDIYVRNFVANATVWVSDDQAFGGAWPTISGDGQKVLYSGSSPLRLVLRDLETQSSEVVHAGSDLYYLGALSDDGRYVAFVTTEVSPGGQSATSDLLFYDAVQETTTLASLNESGTAPGNQGVSYARPLLNDSGSLVVFASNSSDLVAADTNGRADIFAFARPLGGGVLRGEVFADADASGTQNGAEGPLAGWKVFLDANLDGVRQDDETQVITAADGQFVFVGLAPGVYRVAAETRSAFVQTAPVGNVHDATIVADETVSSLDFGFQQQFADLRVDGVFAPLTAAPGVPITIDWDVFNDGDFAALGNWQDSVYLSADGQLDARDTLLGVVAHTGGLALGDSYSATLTTTLPGVLPGNYFLLVESDRRRQVPQANHANDVLASGPVSADIPTLLVGVDRAGTLLGPGNRQYFQVTPSSAQSLEVWLNSVETSGSVAVYVRRGAIPTPGQFDYRGEPYGASAKALIPRTVPGSTYFILVEGQFGAAASAGFTLSARALDLTVNQISPSEGGNTGRVTVRIDGTNLTPTATVQLSHGSAAFDAAAIDYRDATHLYATFDLTGAPLGSYDLFVFDGPENDLELGVFEVVAGTQPPLGIDLVTPANFRVGRSTPIVVEVRNTGNTDVVAPLLRLRSDDALLRLAGEGGLGALERPILVTSADGPAGVLRPGQIGRATLIFQTQPSLGGGAEVGIALERPADDTQTIDWASLEDSSRPLFMPAEAWDIIWDRYTSAAGPTVASYHQLLAASSSYLSQLGIQTVDTARLTRLSILENSGSLLGNVLASEVDLSPDAPGVSLTLGRANLLPLAGRYRLGPLGYGWTHNWEIAAAEDAAGNVAMEQSGGVRYFAKQFDGTYRGAPGDAATLTRVGGALRLRETDGTVVSFRADGRLASVEDPNSNRVTANYDVAGRLASLVHSSGPQLSFDYDSITGRLIQATDSSGRSAVYSYDASGTHLTSVTTNEGTVHYDYVPGTDPATLHALTTLTARDGTPIFYSYDTAGRLSGVEREGGAERTTITYGEFGQISFTDALNETTTVYLNDSAQPELVVDALGRATAYDYDVQRFLSRATTANGAASLFAYNSAGSLLQTTSPLGNQLNLVYESLHQELTQFQDASYKTTNFTIDNRGNASTVRYADGTTEQLTYDAQGNLTRSISRNGDTIDYAYDSRGLLTSVDAPGVGASLYTYDAHGNLLSATDASGTIGMQYDSADRLTRVDYPNGRFVAYEYDLAGRRTRVNQNGFVVNYSYDSVGRLSELHDAGGNLLAKYAYDARGGLVRKDLGNGTYTTYEYDGAGQLAHLVNHKPDNSINSRFDYEYDDVGNVTSMMTLDGTTTYAYDLDGQLTLVALPSGRTIQYVYDASGNRVKVIDDGVETAYASNNLNEYTSVGSATYTYDANGNLTTRTDASGTTTYAFNAFNQLVSVVGPGGSFTYEYDALRNRVAEIKDGQRQEFLFDPEESGQLVGAYDEQGQVLANYVYGGGLVAQIDASKSYYFDFDVVGSTAGLSDTSGGYVNRYTYLPFGETAIVAEAVSNPFRYVGEYGVLDRGNSILDMRSRHYDAMTGQFISDDPLRFGGGDANLRRYVSNNPTGLIDPLGLAGSNPGIIAQALVNRGGRPIDVDLDTQRYLQVCSDGRLEYSGKDSDPSGKIDMGHLQQTDLIAQVTANEITKADHSGVLSALYIPELLGALNANLFGLVKETSDRCFYPKSAFTPEDIVSNAIGSFGPLIRRFIPGVAASDPNDIVGPLGYGAPQFTTPTHVFPYTIRFQNDPQVATAPAQEVFVTQQLDSDLDWTTFELDDVGFGDLTISVPPGLKEFQTQVAYQNQDGSPLLVNFHGGFDLPTGVATWTFRSVDPVSGGLPNGAFDGFLPVDDATGRGSGSIQYLVRPRAGLPTAATIDAQASIVFDINPPLATNVFTNTIDSVAPVAAMNALPAVSNRVIPVSWSGSDDAGGSGLASFTVLVSDNGGPFQSWLAGVTATTASFIGVAGHDYKFRVLAVDHVGLASNPIPAQDVQTRVHSLIWQNALNPLDVNFDTHIAPVDALLVINVLNADQGGAVPPGAAAAAPPYLDTSGDNFVSPVDALLVINYLNALASGSEGEAEAPLDSDESWADLILVSARHQRIAAVGPRETRWTAGARIDEGHRELGRELATRVNSFPDYAIGLALRRESLPLESIALLACLRGSSNFSATDLVLERLAESLDDDSSAKSDVRAWLDGSWRLLRRG